MAIQNLALLIAQIKELCDRWQITEFALFGSVLRDDFKPTSDAAVSQRYPHSGKNSWL